jgi:hypothetical protein
MYEARGPESRCSRPTSALHYSLAFGYQPSASSLWLTAESLGLLLTCY